MKLNIFITFPWTKSWRTVKAKCILSSAENAYCYFNSRKKADLAKQQIHVPCNYLNARWETIYSQLRKDRPLPVCRYISIYILLDLYLYVERCSGKERSLPELVTGMLKSCVAQDLCTGMEDLWLNQLFWFGLILV